MDAEYNLTYITLGGHVDVDKFRYLYFMIVFLVYIFILCSNSVIVYLIWIHQDLHEPMYIFIAALLLNSVIFSTNIYPKLLIDFLSEKQITTHQGCVLQYFMFYTLSGSEFLLLAAMAYDRYVSICKPLQYSMIMRKKTVGMLLALAWLLPACELMALAIITANQKICSFTLNVIFCNNSIYKLHCVWSRVISLFGALILVNVVLLPILFILFTYAKIFIITYKHSIEVRKKAAQTCLPHLLVLISFSFLITFDVVLVRLESDLSKTAHLIITLQMILYHPLFNPIIYGLKMKGISKHLKTLLSHCKSFLCNN
ncbi:olfactory receptor 2T27-like [Parambassis ranga]|uniref:Olfactory receptor n=1 Tax=Parambassis ranga TaxID=210632 RepID=A0A6P7H7Q5_9TELE|nr:olfactory receptor 2T27-like [Parambassis ranga]